MNDNDKMKISEVIERLTRLKDTHGDLYMRAMDEYGEDRYDIVFMCSGDECIITSGPQM